MLQHNVTVEGKLSCFLFPIQNNYADDYQVQRRSLLAISDVYACSRSSSPIQVQGRLCNAPLIHLLIIFEWDIKPCSINYLSHMSLCGFNIIKRFM